MRPRITDIKTGVSGRNRIICNPHPAAREVKNNGSNKKQEMEEENLTELLNPSRRTFLKIVAASGGVFLLGKFLSKFNNLEEIASLDKSKKSNRGSKEEDLDGLHIVSNANEYILYNKNGETLITVDKDI